MNNIFYELTTLLFAFLIHVFIIIKTRKEDKRSTGVELNFFFFFWVAEGCPSYFFIDRLLEKISIFFFFSSSFFTMSATTEELQTFVLNTLEKQTTIEDSKDLTHNDKPVDQLALLGALNSLKSKDVKTFFTRAFFFFSYSFSFR